MSREDCGAPDWMDNLEFRIIQLEEWRKEHESSVEKRIREEVQMNADITSIKNSLQTQKDDLKDQRVITERQNSKLDKLVYGIGATIILGLIKILLDLTILKPNAH